MKLIHLVRLLNPDLLIDFFEPMEEGSNTQQVYLLTPPDLLYKVDVKYFDYPAVLEYDEEKHRTSIKLID